MVEWSGTAAGAFTVACQQRQKEKRRQLIILCSHFNGETEQVVTERKSLQFYKRVFSKHCVSDARWCSLLVEMVEFGSLDKVLAHSCS